MENLNYKLVDKKVTIEHLILKNDSTYDLSKICCIDMKNQTVKYLSDVSTGYMFTSINNSDILFVMKINDEDTEEDEEDWLYGM